MSGADASLEARFEEAIASGGAGATGRPLVVAVSGGVDSCVLLHLLRFRCSWRPGELVVAHYDHRMRESSAADARWVAGLCRAWDVHVRIARADATPRSEDAARTRRYGFLESVRSEVGADFVLTAHHADDQAETVLFRVLRGTGSAGLAGIPRRREPGLFRPLLGFWRAEIEAYAERSRLAWREDPSNRRLRYARNVLRTRVLPDVERLVAPGARRALVRLADLARRDEAGWDSLLAGLLEPLRVTSESGGVSFERDGLLALHPAVRARVLRALGEDVGVRLDEAGTRRAAAFAETGRSGSAIDLGGSVALGRQLDRLVLGIGRPDGVDRPLPIPDVGPGRGDALLGGATVPVAWGGGEGGSRANAQWFDPDLLRFPLLVRSRAPGDRIRLPNGTKKVKKILLEKRIPAATRDRVPLLVDSEGEVLWIPGIARAEKADPGGGSGLWIGVG